MSSLFLGLHIDVFILTICAVTSGCNVSRLRDFILDFYARSEQAQVVDDALCAFVWSVVVQQPNVRVGIVPPDVDWEVYIAPQPSTKRKGKGQTEGEEDGQPVSLQVIPDAAIKPLEELVRQYGNTLRIAVDPETSFVAISGSHARVGVTCRIADIDR